MSWWRRLMCWVFECWPIDTRGKLSWCIDCGRALERTPSGWRVARSLFTWRRDKENPQ